MNQSIQYTNFDEVLKNIDIDFNNSFNKENINLSKQVDNNFLKFCEQSFLALNSVYPKQTNKIIEKTLLKYDVIIKNVKKNNHKIENINFLYPIKKVSVITKSGIKTSFNLIPILQILEFFEINNVDTIDKILSIGFLIQSDVYESIIIDIILKNNI